MVSKNNPENMLLELAQLDKRLERLQLFFQESKSMTVEGSLFTPENIEQFIRLLENINPSEKAMICTLKMLLSLSKQNKTEIERKTNESQSSEISQTTPCTICTAKLKGRMMPNRII
jgi:hypothetical protein